MKRIATLLGLIGLTFLMSPAVWGQARPTLEERLIRLEEGMRNLEKRFDDMNKRIDDTNKRIDDLRTDMNTRLDDIKNFMFWGFGILFSGMFILVGFILWDRRTTLAPVARQTKELAETNEKTLAALREFAKTNKVMQEALRKVGML